jgi:hypothetical protein
MAAGVRVENNIRYWIVDMEYYGWNDLISNIRYLIYHISGV